MASDNVLLLWLAGALGAIVGFLPWHLYLQWAERRDTRILMENLRKH